MILFLKLMTMTTSAIFLTLSHPLTLGLALLIQSVMIAMITSYNHYNSWYSYILFLIMVGGMLILFMYMTSVASNEKFQYSNKITGLLITLLILFIVTAMIMDQFINTMEYKQDTQELDSIPMWKMSFSKFFFFPANMILITLIIYLFVTLIVIVKITDITHGPLRQKF
uniref:NADH-ubiquinone oxidoreductase chain 6 n=1 Tax=Acmaeodera sp. NCS-2009 TaxID=590154 RepID=D1G5N2_9COLE|nr:NADH dehydrogenase subunit 6 [Acmaeodera sp. NCS-2009]ACM45047.1 NADH dehydrogenase subunit 6 [Acmaeodera sp. NCS-2009]